MNYRVLSVAVIVWLFALNIHTDATIAESNRTMIICYNFGKDFRLYDEPVLKQLIDRFKLEECRTGRVHVVLCPFDTQDCGPCGNVASELGIECDCKSQEERSSLGISNAPSYRVETSDGRIIALSSQTRIPIMRVPNEWFNATGSLQLINADLGVPTRRIRLWSNRCPGIEFDLDSSKTVYLPAGAYTVSADGDLSGKIDILEQQATSFTVERSIYTQDSPREPHSRLDPETSQSAEWEKRDYNNITLGLAIGGYVMEIQERDYRILLSGGLSLRVIGVLGIEACLMADTSFNVEGASGFVDFAPSFFIIRNEISFSVKFGWLYLKPDAFGRDVFHNQLEYSAPVVGFSVFMGRVGRDIGTADDRIGVSIEVRYSQKKTFFQGAGRLESSPYWIGGLHAGLVIQFEAGL